MLSGYFEHEVSEEINRICNSIESKRDTSIKPSIRFFLVEIIRESVQFRQKEWHEKKRLNVDDSVLLRSVFRENIYPSVNNILSEVPISPEFKQVLLIDVIRTIHNKFCNIFPLC